MKIKRKVVLDITTLFLSHSSILFNFVLRIKRLHNSISLYPDYGHKAFWIWETKFSLSGKIARDIWKSLLFVNNNISFKTKNNCSGAAITWSHPVSVWNEFVLRWIIIHGIMQSDGQLLEQWPGFIHQMEVYVYIF